MATVEQIWDVVEPYLAAEKLELDDLELIGHGRSRTLRVVLDHASSDEPGSGIPDSDKPTADRPDVDTPDADRPATLDLDRISEVSKGLSRLLDSSVDLEGPYQLEVSSPGLERKLSRQSHFLKSLGREVIVKTSDGTLRGVLTKADEAAFEVSTQGGPQTLPYERVVSARTVFRWERAPKPGQAKKQS